MKADPGLPGSRRLAFWLLCQLNRHPSFWRTFGAVIRRWPGLGGLLHFAARNSAVTQALRRTDSFLNTTHRPNLVAGNFLIGMNPDAQYKADRELFLEMMPTRTCVRESSAAEARSRIEAVQAGGSAQFDLVQDYLMWIVLRAALPAFGDAAETIAGDRFTQAADDAEKFQYMLELRHVGAQLFAGGAAPAPVQMRAEAAAASLKRRIRRAGDLLNRQPAAAKALASSAADQEMVQRDGVGYAWVSHPVTVQAGALIVFELLRRRAEYDNLRAKAEVLGSAVWTDAAFRELVELHVLELMRFRPVFPVLGRDVPRDTTFDAGSGHCPAVKGGGSLTMITISAMFDPRVVSANDAYDPARPWLDRDERTLMFGYGERRCPGRDRAIDILVSAMIGVLSLPRIRQPRWPSPGRMKYDGPMVESMPLEFGGGKGWVWPWSTA